MKKAFFIHTNNKQSLGAILSKYSIERFLKPEDNIKVEIINVDEIIDFKNFAGKEYLRKGNLVIYDPNDLQSFTLSRFMPPALMNYEGMAVVIDPDIFALRDPRKIFDIDMGGKVISCCSKKEAWDTSMMLMDCAKLREWNIASLLRRLEEKTLDYNDIMTLKVFGNDRINEVPRIWNNLDTLTNDTVFIHTTNRLTQPWKTGLPIDFTRNKMPKLFGIIPREPIHKLLGKHPTHYQAHPNPEVEKMFLQLTKEAIDCGKITDQMLDDQIAKKYIRADIREAIAKLK